MKTKKLIKKIEKAAKKSEKAILKAEYYQDKEASLENLLEALEYYTVAFGK
jgi:hypothetical protein